MEWKLVSEYSKKFLNENEYDNLKLCVYELEKMISGEQVECIKEVEKNSINLLIKKHENGDVFLFLLKRFLFLLLQKFFH